MAGPARTPPGKKTVQPPRPPNAWILYRAEKSKIIGRKAQADVSREISAMWKAESPLVRAEYERRADIKKAEHQAMYPEYRFQPVKREEKERLREVKKQEKERKKEAQRRGRADPQPEPATPAQPQPSRLYAPTAHPLLTSFGSFYHSDPRYGPSGPTPPLSAAPSPADSGPDLPHSRVEEFSTSPSAHASSYPQTPTSAYGSPAMPPSTYGASLAHSQSPEPDGSLVAIPPDSTQWKGSQSTLPPSIITTGDNWPTGFDGRGESGPEDFLTFDLPNTPFDSVPAWDTNLSSDYSDIHAILSSTGDPSIFQLTNFDPQILLNHPTGQLEVSLGQMDFTGFDEPIPNLTDLPFFASQPSTTAEFSSNDLTSFFTPTEQPTSSIHDSNGLYNGDDYLDFDGHSPDTSLTLSQPATTTPAQPPAESPRPPYVPPSGASQSSTRRVGGSWQRPPPSLSSPLDQTPPRSNWSVHA